MELLHKLWVTEYEVPDWNVARGTLGVWEGLGRGEGGGGDKCPKKGKYNG